MEIVRIPEFPVIIVKSENMFTVRRGTKPHPRWRGSFCLGVSSYDAGERGYVITTLADGKWYAVSPDSLLLRMTAMAILEKE